MPCPSCRLRRSAHPKLAVPARRTLSAAGYTRLDQLAQVSEPDLTKLHGIGATAIAALREALHEHGLSFYAGVLAPGHLHGVAGSPGEVDEYLRGVQKPGRSTLQTLRRTILEIVPDAKQVISYRVPAFRARGCQSCGTRHQLNRRPAPRGMRGAGMSEGCVQQLL